VVGNDDGGVKFGWINELIGEKDMEEDVLQVEAQAWQHQLLQL
jgi:hypothetical protein